jgi:hypothetical protein
MHGLVVGAGPPSHACSATLIQYSSRPVPLPPSHPFPMFLPPSGASPPTPATTTSSGRRRAASSAQACTHRCGWKAAAAAGHVHCAVLWCNCLGDVCSCLPATLRFRCAVVVGMVSQLLKCCYWLTFSLLPAVLLAVCSCWAAVAPWLSARPATSLPPPHASTRSPTTPSKQQLQQQRAAIGWLRVELELLQAGEAAVAAAAA